MKFFLILVLTSVFFGLTGCTSTPLPIDTGPLGPDEKILGPVYKQGTGVLLLYFIPIGQNDRFEKAYIHAIRKYYGATRLTDVTIQEKWFWGVILSGYKFRLRGYAVGPK